MKEDSTVNSGANRLTTLLFVVYLIALYWILLLKLGVQFSYMASRRANLVPFKYGALLSSQNILNVVIFIPLGLYAGLLFKKWSLGQKFLFVFFVSLLVEVLQYMLRLGAFDVTDLITNTMGGTIGLVLLKLIDEGVDDRLKVQRLINIIAASGTVIMILLFVLLKMNMLPVRYQ